MTPIELKKLVKDLFSDIKYHDFYYNYADDGRAYRTGESEERNIIDSIAEILKQSPESEESLLRNCLKLKTNIKLQNQIKAFFLNAKRKL